MNASDLKAMFPHASPSFLAKNVLPSGDTYAVKGDPYQIGKPTIRQKVKKVSKLQADFLQWLRSSVSVSNHLILDEVINLEIANGCKYRPDAWTILSVRHAGIDLIKINAWEVKGLHAWDDSIVKLKVAARAFPWISFNLATRPERLGAWRIQRIES